MQADAFASDSRMTAVAPSFNMLHRTPALVSSRKRRWRRVAAWLTGLHVASLAVLWHLIWNVSEAWWVGSAVTFLPRLPWLIPGLLLLVLSAAARSRTFWVNAAAMLLATHFIGGWNVPWPAVTERFLGNALPSPSEANTFRIVSANVQNFQPDVGLLMREIQHERPDVVALQEAFRPPRAFVEQFVGWHSVHVRGYWVGSRWPLRLLGRCDSDVYQRETAIAVEIQAPFGAFVLTDLHLMTARKSLVELKPHALLSGDAKESVQAALLERDEESRQTRTFILESASARPSMVVGDFNMPTSSNIYRENFGDYTNAFEASCFGFGYTAPCRRISFWPSNTPWQRIDHILADSHWRVLSCRVGQFDGSDHRIIAATLELVPRNDAASHATKADGPPDLSAEVDRLR